LKLIDQNRFDVMLLEPLNYNVDNSSTDLDKIDLLAELFKQEYAEYDWKSWLLQQIDHLEELTYKAISLQENTKSLKERFYQIYQILEE
jgi:hypothetical protein